MGVNTDICNYQLFQLQQITDKMDSLSGATLMKADGSKVEAEKALENKDLVLYYFSAHWCPPAGSSPPCWLTSTERSLMTWRSSSCPATGPPRTWSPTAALIDELSGNGPARVVTLTEDRVRLSPFAVAFVQKLD